MIWLNRLGLMAVMLIVPSAFHATSLPQNAPNISVNGSLSPDETERSRRVQGTVVVDIPSGYHINSNRPLEKFLVATVLKIDAARGLQISAVSYPRAVLRQFKFSKNRVAVYEGRATMRFAVMVPANFSSGATELKAHVRYQSCNDEMCFPPQTRDVSLWLKVR